MLQPVRINRLSRVSTKVASFLHLPDAEIYTGHSMRRPFAALAANAGRQLTHKSHTVVGSYPGVLSATLKGHNE